MIIAFCTPCMNRQWQLRRTLARNLEVLHQTEHFIALVDFNSQDDLPTYIRANFAQQCGSGQLVYFRTTQPISFHASKAKNLAHRLGMLRAADVLFNLDADNFVTRGTLAKVSEAFDEGADACFHQWSMRSGDGSFGRIALRAKTWHKLGGYDERFKPMAWQDVDILNRARAAGLRYWLVSPDGPAAIQNSLDQKLINTGCLRATGTPASQQYLRMDAANMATSFARPIFIPMSEQGRYEGTLNFQSDLTV